MPALPYYYVNLGYTEVSTLKPGMSIWGTIDGNDVIAYFYDLDTYFIINSFSGGDTGYALKITTSGDVYLRRADSVRLPISADIYIGYKKGEKRLISQEFLMNTSASDK